MMKFAAVALFLALAFTGLMFFAELMKQGSLFYPERYPGGYWNIAEIAKPVDAHFETSDGVRLHGWYFPAEKTDAPLLIWFHGNGGNLTYRAPMAIELARRGVAVFLFDYRGYGKSEGQPSERGLFRDSLAAFDFATARYGNGRSVVLYGESLGGPYAADVALKRKACGLIVENSFSSLASIANAIYRPIPIGVLVHRSLRTADWLRSAGVPVLVMHGRNDRVIPFAEGKNIYDALREPKELFISERADHSGIPQIEGDRYYDAVIAFIAKHCRR